MPLTTIFQAYARTWVEWYVHMILVIARTSRAWWLALSPSSPVSIKTSRYNENGQGISLYRPTGIVNSEIASRPAILFVHGGAWTLGFGSRHDFSSHCLYLARLGYTVGSVSYRLLPKHPYPAGYDDLRDAVTWMHKKTKKPIILIGHSAGAHLSLLLGLKETTMPIESIVSLAAPSNLNETLPVIEVEKRLFLRNSKADEASPFSIAAQFKNHPEISSSLPNFYIFHGDRDVVIPISQSLALVDALNDINASVKLHVMEGVSHWFPFVSEKDLSVVGSVMEEILEALFPKSPSNFVLRENSYPLV